MRRGRRARPGRRCSRSCARRGHHHDLVEASLPARLVQQRHLRDADPGRVRQRTRAALASVRYSRDDERMQQVLEKRERFAVGEDDGRRSCRGRPAVLAQDRLAEALDERRADVGSSAARRWWTISSLETVAAPWRLNAASAWLLPAPMPPVMGDGDGLERGARTVSSSGAGSAASGLVSRRLVGEASARPRRRRRLGCLGRPARPRRRRLRLLVLGSLRPRGSAPPRARASGSSAAGSIARLGDDIGVSARGVGLELHGLVRTASARRAGREDVLGEVEVRRRVHRLGAVRARQRLAPLDALQREREAARRRRPRGSAR